MNNTYNTSAYIAVSGYFNIIKAIKKSFTKK